MAIVPVTILHHKLRPRMSVSSFFFRWMCIKRRVFADVFSAAGACTERDTDRGELDVRDSGDGHVAERRMCRRVIRRGTARDGNVRLAHGRKQHPRQRRQYLVDTFCCCHAGKGKCGTENDQLV